MQDSFPHGAGLGFRRELLPELRTGVPAAISFFELAPENWIGLGGAYARDLRQFTERHTFVAHGLSLSLGGPSPLDEELLRQIKLFMSAHGIALYTEHLAWCSDDAHLYDLLPIPLTEAAVHHVAARVRRAQDILGRRIAIENTSYYIAPPGAEMDEVVFIREILAEADCDLHLDINNLYVNSRNFRFDPLAFLNGLPLERIVYLHVAGHDIEPDGLLIDTHGAAVIDPVWALLEEAYARLGPRPTLLERDFNLPTLADLEREVATVVTLQTRHSAPTRNVSN